MLLNNWNTVLQTSFQNLWSGVINFLPNLLVAIIIFVLGWVVGIVLGQWVARVIKSLQVDKALKSLGAEEVLGKAGFRLDPGAFIGGLVKWFVIVAFLVASFNVLGLSQVNEFLTGRILDFLPRLIIASLILILAAAIADILAKIVSGTAKAAGVSSSSVFGTFTKWAVWVVAIFAVIGQLGVLDQSSGPMGGLASAVIQYGIMALALAFGLAFGLGGKDAAARYLERLREDMKSHHHQQ
ncbi:MAG: hypothetical protein V1704_03500 [Candidatus Vogelbacteria bacterium]